ncbi:hypothetical protein [Dyadobacter sediminis]|uniref:6-phosphogluconate dehydrogenase n=1 Tax=Dyadobacter sediminis TaxID=1493691 RepID=A0A5R9K5X9_9BACT|nr:hypothetical protein [Dyadobacter sediminis]TLU89058.1 hypothetical protein FEM55_23510 [Dyadobacter sediminis]GGC03147.1 hypothetical protein GCM10011325_32780 [Dyadobacter sediminis]
MRKWVIFAIFLAIVFGILYYLTFGYYSEGKRGGFVTRLSNKGYLFKTYEGELRMGGLYEGEGTMNSQRWIFSVSSKNKDAIAKLEDAIANGHRVSLTYEEKFFQLPWNGDTQFFVTNVEVLDTGRGSNFPPAAETPKQLPAPTELDTNATL